jgi:hypothetical protein
MIRGKQPFNEDVAAEQEARRVADRAPFVEQNQRAEVPVGIWLQERIWAQVEFA